MQRVHGMKKDRYLALDRHTARTGADEFNITQKQISAVAAECRSASIDDMEDSE